MSKVKLMPKTKRLKQLIKIHGDVWEIIDSKIVQCFNDQGWFVQSKDKSHKRWIQRHEFTFLNQL